MAKAKKLYWLGKGLVKVDGKLYGKGSDHGRAFPTAKVDDDRLAQWQKDGLVSDKPFEDDDSLTTIEQLNAKVKDLSVQIVELNKAGVSGACEKCKELETENSDLKSKVEEAEKMLESITDDGSGE